MPQISIQNPKKGRSRSGILHVTGLGVCVVRIKTRIIKKIHLMPPFSCKKISLGKTYITKFKECTETHSASDTHFH
jgi:hypothetical protein